MPEYQAIKLFGDWIVRTEMMCSNGLVSWVIIANCGNYSPENEICGFDPEEYANLIAKSLNETCRNKK